MDFRQHYLYNSEKLGIIYSRILISIFFLFFQNNGQNPTYPSLESQSTCQGHEIFGSAGSQSTSTKRNAYR